MADAIPTPAGEPQAPIQSTVVIKSPPLTQWQALKEAGWWTPYDWVMTGLIGLVGTTTAFWLIFSSHGPESVPVTTGLILALLVKLDLLGIWIVSLAFRCSWFVLRVHADIAMLPHESARIAASFLAGKQ
jgi:hypothetical protein